MSRGTRRTVRGRRWATVALAPGVVTMALIVTAPAASAFTRIHIGQTHNNYLCSAADQWIQTGTAGPSYVVPAGSTKLIRWMTNGGASAGTMQFELWAPAGGLNYKLVYISAPTVLTAATIAQVALKPQINVVPGDVIGYRSVTAADCALKTGKATDTYVYSGATGVPTVGSTVAFQGPATGFRFNIAAVVR